MERATAAGAFLAIAILLVSMPPALQGQGVPATVSQTDAPAPLSAGSDSAQAPQSANPNSVPGDTDKQEQATPATATDPNAPPPPQIAIPNPTLDDTMEAGGAEAEEFSRKLVSWNHYEGRFFSIRVGGGFLLDYGAYAQDDEGKEQFALTPDWKVRDSRIMLNGTLKFSRPVTWTCGIMYDGYINQFLVRQCGVMVKIPEMLGYIFVGRGKEGFSLNKVMTGYAGWTMERATINDATIPILADGIQWLGYAPKQHLIWTLGTYTDWLSKGQSFSTYAYQTTGRFAYVPIESEKTVLHLGISGRYGKPKDSMLQLRSRPELSVAPYFIDTGEFAVNNTKMLGLEVYYRPGPFLFGSEYFVQWADAAKAGNPVFHGGEAVFSWMTTGEIRAYNTRGGYFDQVSVLHSVFQGGRGAWEILGRFSYSDLDSGAIQGGKFWRITPMLNWYLSNNVRLETAYGYGSLNRFNVVGKTQFLQTRLQLQF